MQAAFIRRLGGPNEIEVGQLPIPEPRHGEVLVETEAMAVNHVDTFVRSGAYATELPMPFIIGRDLVGRVVASGAGVEKFDVGDRVWCNSLGYGGRQGSFAEFAAVPVDRLYPLPEGIDAGEAVSALHSAATAHIGLFREAGLAAGETVFVGGAAGGVGSAVVQLAAAAGARVIATAAADDAGWVASCGAAEVFDYRDPDVPKRIAAAAPEGLDVHWDTSSHHDLETTVPLLRHGGRIIAMAGLGARPVLPVGDLYARDASILGFAISNAGVEDLAAAAVTINQIFDDGELKSRITQRLPLTEAASAHRLQEATGENRVHGRIVVVP